MCKKILRGILAKALITVLLGSSTIAYAAPVVLDDGTVFDAEYYANTYPDLKAVYGDNYDALLQHYLYFGKLEGRIACESTIAQQLTQQYSEQLAQQQAEAAQAEAVKQSIVPIDKLENKSSLKKKCTDAEFQAAYDAALEIVTPLVGLSREEQLYGIASAIRYKVDSGQVVYSTSAAHYNDPYGYFVTGVSSCAGCARATGLCLNMLGISYEHVNENQWSHQWCRVNVDGTYWICDAYGLYVGPEPAPYQHPYL